MGAKQRSDAVRIRREEEAKGLVADTAGRFIR
jgi:hypothetical protein